MAEEKKSGTMELLMTSPITTWQVLMGKFFSCLTIYFFMMSLTIVFNIIMMIHSRGQLDWGPVLSSYVGLLLFGATLISIGMFFSSLTENQIIAGAVSITFVLALYILVFTAQFLKPPINHIVLYLSTLNHYETFTRGLIGIKNIIYF